MATDNAVMRYKDIKYYNEKLQDSMPSGGGVSSLADLGITLSAAEINNLPTDKYAYTDVAIGIPPKASPTSLIRAQHYINDAYNSIVAAGEVFYVPHHGNIIGISCDSYYVRLYIDFTQPDGYYDSVTIRVFYKVV